MPLPCIPDYSVSIKTPQLLHPSILSGGHPIEKGNNLVKYSGGFCVVFPYQTARKKYAVRCWHAEVRDAMKRTQIISAALKESQLPYFVGFEYYEDGIMTPVGVQPVVVMDWVDALPLKQYVLQNLGKTENIRKLANAFKQMVADLHDKKFSHGDLQHGNIMVRDDGKLVLVDYDSMFVPGLEDMSDDIKGLVGYQHEARWNNNKLTEKLDYFSELVIYTSLQALQCDTSLWYRLKMEDSETMLFSAEDICSKGSSTIFQELRNHEELKPLVDALCNFMQCTSIDELLPLEQVLMPTVDRISSKWEDGNGYSLADKKPKIEDSSTISDKWSSGNGFNSVFTEEKADQIAALWRN